MHLSISFLLLAAIAVLAQDPPPPSPSPPPTPPPPFLPPPPPPPMPPPSTPSSWEDDFPIFVYCIMGAGSLMVILPILYVCCQCDEWSCCTYQQDPTSEKHEAAAQKQRSKEGVYGPSV